MTYLPGHDPYTEETFCFDCEADTAPLPIKDGTWEWYMVQNDLWAEVAQSADYLCVGCFEARLGRCLTTSDFLDAPINQLHSEDSPRLLARKGLV